MSKDSMSIVREENPFWNCLCARVRSTGEMIMVKNIHAFEPELVPEWVQIGISGIELRHFKHHELEFSE